MYCHLCTIHKKQNGNSNIYVRHNRIKKHIPTQNTNKFTPNLVTPQKPLAVDFSRVIVMIMVGTVAPCLMCCHLCFIHKKQYGNLICVCLRSLHPSIVTTQVMEQVHNICVIIVLLEKLIRFL
jgi:hypothetical protein